MKSILIKWVTESNREGSGGSEREERLLSFRATPPYLLGWSAQRGPPKMSISHQDKRPR